MKEAPVATQPIVKEVVLRATADQVWKAITDKNQMKQWYFDIEKFEPEVGFEFEFTGEGLKGEKYVHLCKITEVEEGKKLSYSWRYEGYEGISYVSFELFPEGDKTRLKLTHRGLETFTTDNPDFAKENFNQGWTEIIGTSLKNYVEKE